MKALFLVITFLGQGAQAPQPNPATTSTATVTSEAVQEVVKTIYLSNIATSQGRNDIVAALHTQLQMTQIALSRDANAIVLRDTADKVAAAEKLILELDKPQTGTTPAVAARAPASAVTIDADGNLFVTENGQLKRMRTPGPQLQIKSATPISIEMNENVRDSFGRVAKTAGLNLIFDPDLLPGDPTPFTVVNTAIADTLDKLSAKTGTFWQVLGGKTILVAPDNLNKRLSYEMFILKTITLSNSVSPQAIHDIDEMLKTMIGIRNLGAIVATNTIVIGGTPNNVALAEKLIADVDIPRAGNPSVLPQFPPAPVVAGISRIRTDNVLVLDDGRILNVSPKRAQLRIKTAGPVSIELNENARASYENLAARAGLNIIFDRDMQSRNAEMFKVDDVDILDALDYLSLQTGTFWSVLDSKTIFVAPDNIAKRRDDEPVMLKTIYLPRNRTTSELNDIGSTVRRMLNINTLMVSAASGAIVIRDTWSKIVLAERIISDFDKLAEGGTARTAPVPVTTVLGAGTITQQDKVLVFDAGGVRNITPKRSQVQPRITRPLSIRIVANVRVSWETLAAMSGLNIVFDRNLESGSAELFKLDDVDILDALDYLSLQTRTFWSVLDSKTIFVSPDNSTKRRDHDPTVLKTIYLTHNGTAQEFGNVVRQSLNISTLVMIDASNAIVMKDEGSKIVLAEMLLSDLDRGADGSSARSAPLPVATVLGTGTVTSADKVLVFDAGGVRNLTPKRSQIQPSITRPVSIRIVDNARASWETLAAMAGLNIVFDRDLQFGSAELFKLDEVDILDAFDYLSQQTRTFWIVLDRKTIFVAPDNSTKRRDYEPVMLKTIYLTHNRTAQEFGNVARQILNITTMVVSVSSNAVVIRDSESKIVLAEKLLSDLDRGVGGGAAGTAPVPVATAIGAGTISNTDREFHFDAVGVRDTTPKRSQIQPSIKRPVSIRIVDNARICYETLAAMAGLNIVFDRDFQSGSVESFKVDDVDILDALDYLSLQTATFWIVLDSKTIFVAPDTAAKRRDYEPLVLKTIHLAHNRTIPELNEIQQILRMSGSISNLAVSAAANAIVIRDKASAIVLAEKIVSDLDATFGGGSAKSAMAPVTTALGTGTAMNTDRIFVSDPGGVRNITPKRSQIQPSITGPISIRFVGNARVSWEALAAMAGLTVQFDPRWSPVDASPFHLENTDILDALDFLALQSGSFWQVVGSKTLFVAPDTAAVRRELSPQITRTFTLSSTRTLQDVNDVISLLRSLVLGLNPAVQIAINGTNGIDVKATPNQLVIAEKILTDLGLPRR